MYDQDRDSREDITTLSATDSFSACKEYLAETACHFLLLLVGFDTLTCRKDYDRSPTLVGHQDPSLKLSASTTKEMATGSGTALDTWRTRRMAK